MIDARLAPYGALALRVALGAMFIAHAYLKLAVFTMPGFAARLVSAALLPVLLGALVIHAPNGWFFTAPNGGWEYPAFLALAALAQVLIGDGAYALRPITLPGAASAQPAPRAA